MLGPGRKLREEGEDGAVDEGRAGLLSRGSSKGLSRVAGRTDGRAAGHSFRPTPLRSLRGRRPRARTQAGQASMTPGRSSTLTPIADSRPPRHPLPSTKQPTQSSLSREQLLVVRCPSPASPRLPNATPGARTAVAWSSSDPPPPPLSLPRRTLLVSPPPNPSLGGRQDEDQKDGQEGRPAGQFSSCRFRCGSGRAGSRGGRLAVATSSDAASMLLISRRRAWAAVCLERLPLLGPEELSPSSQALD